MNIDQIEEYREVAESVSAYATDREPAQPGFLTCSESMPGLCRALSLSGQQRAHPRWYS